jgi:2',3'-cyclic-nucleotide 2'-phosphodiesterase (5'-nucleotidase family)
MLAFLLACVAARPVPPVAAPSVSVAPPQQRLRTELSSEGRLRTRLARQDEAELVVYYSAEQSGDLGPCGCPTRPRGGLARMAAYTAASRAQSPTVPSLVVNSGQWLEDAVGMDGEPRADMPTLNRWMVQAQVALGPDALNVSNHEIAGLAAIGGDARLLPLVSANVQGPGISEVIVVERAGRRIAITGIAARGMTLRPTPGYTMTDPYPAAKALLQRTEADLKIVLSYHAREAAKRLAEDGLVDLVIDAHRHRTLDVPSQVGSALWVRAHFQAMRMGELRLGFGTEGLAWALDRKIDLDEDLPDEPAQAAIYTAAKQELRPIEIQLYGRPKN